MRKIVSGLLPLMAGVLLVLLAGRGEGPPSAVIMADNVEHEHARIFLILPGDAGRHGARVACGDSLISYPLQQQKNVATLRESLDALFTARAPAGAYNAFGRASLRIREIAIKDGIATIALVGVFKPQTSCDGARAEAQLEATVTQFPRTRSARITINDRGLETFVKPLDSP